MNCCRKTDNDDCDDSTSMRSKGGEPRDNEYFQNLEAQYACMQQAYIHLSTRFAQLQFFVRKMLQSPEEQERLMGELQEIAFAQLSEHDCENMSCKEYELISMQKDVSGFGEVENKQNTLLTTLRGQLKPLDDIQLEIDNGDGDDDNIITSHNEHDEPNSVHAAESDLIDSSSDTNCASLCKKKSREAKEKDSAKSERQAPQP